MAGSGDLRCRLADMRSDLVRQLGAGPAIDDGLLSLLGNVGAALAALDDNPVEGIERAERVVIGDDGRVIVLTLYTGREAVASVELDPAAACWLASRLLAAVSYRWPCPLANTKSY